MFATTRVGKCSLACPTPGEHASLGECMRAKSTRVAYCNSANNFDYTAQKKQDRDLDAYADAKRQGIQPATTQRRAVDDAVALSNLTGTAFQA